MDPEIRYGRAYVPRKTYSYITTSNIDRKRSKSYSRHPVPDQYDSRDWTPSKTQWMPKREWYYGAYEELYAPSSSLKSRLRAGAYDDVSRRRAVDDIHYELNRFRPPHLESDASFSARRARDHKSDANWQDHLDMYYPNGRVKFYTPEYADKYSNPRFSRDKAYNTERLNDVLYDTTLLRRGQFNNYPATLRAQPYPPSGRYASLYDEVEDYMFPSKRPSRPRGMPVSYLNKFDDWKKTTPYDFNIPARYLDKPEPYRRAKSQVRPRYTGARAYSPPSYRGQSYSPTRARTYPKLPSYSSPSAPSYTPSRTTYDSGPTEDVKPRTPTRVRTTEPERSPERPRRAAREPSPPARPARERAAPRSPTPERKQRRFAPDLEEPSLEKRRIPDVSDETPKTRKQKSVDEPAPSPRRVSKAEPEPIQPNGEAEPAFTNGHNEPEPQPEAPAEEVPAEEEPEPVAEPTPKAATPKATPRQSVSEEPAAPTPKARTPVATPKATPRQSVADEPAEPTPRASVASTPKATPRQSVAEEPAARTPKASIAKTPVETPRQSVSDNVIKPKQNGLGWSTSKSPKPSVADSAVPEAEEEQPAEETEEVFEEAEPVAEEEPEAAVEPEEEVVEEAYEEAPVEEEQQVEPEEQEQEPEPEPEKEEEPQENGHAEEEVEEFEFVNEEDGGRRVGKTIVTTTKTTTETSYEEVEEYEEVVTTEEVVHYENGMPVQPDELEYEEDESEINPAPRRKFSDSGDLFNDEDE